MTHETAKEWAARPGAVVRYFARFVHGTWRVCDEGPFWQRNLSYAIFDGRHNVLVSIGPDAKHPEIGSQMFEALGAPKNALVRAAWDGVVVGKPHPLQADIVKWAGDPERWGWETRDIYGGWRGTKFPPQADTDPTRWRLIDRHAPKGPLTEAPEVGEEEYWLPSLMSDDYCQRVTWTGSAEAHLLLYRRLCFRTREEAADLGRRMAEMAMEGER